MCLLLLLYRVIVSIMDPVDGNNEMITLDSTVANSNGITITSQLHQLVGNNTSP